METHERILTWLKDKYGYDYSANKSAMLERHINRRMKIHHCNSSGEYLDILCANPLEAKKLTDGFTINVSRFFRNSIVFEWIEQEIIPYFFDETGNTTQSNVRIWSAGCASGEEPYSLAILLHEYAEKYKLKPQIQLFASDIDKEALKIAQTAVYHADSLSEVKLGRVRRYFYKTGEKYEVAEEIRNMVHFYEYDLLDKQSYSLPASVFGGFNLILCRNVLIYFETDYQKMIFEKLYRSLNQGGFLILGEAEMVPDDLLVMFKPLKCAQRIYMKLK